MSHYGSKYYSFVGFYVNKAPVITLLFSAWLPLSIHLIFLTLLASVYKCD